MNNTETVLSVLRQTNDGDALQPQDLMLLQTAVNGELSPAGAAELNRLLTEVATGEYFERVRWLCSIPHLTRDAHGYVYWKGKRVEHFSHSDPAEMAVSAAKLASRCLLLEANGMPVTGRTTLLPSCYNALPQTPWKKALLNYYAFFERKDKRLVGIFSRTKMARDAGAADAFVIYAEAGQVVVEDHAGVYEAFHSVQDRGFKACDHNHEFNAVQALLYGLCVTTERLDQEIGESTES